MPHARILLLVLPLLVGGYLREATPPAQAGAAPTRPISPAESNPLRFLDPISVVADRTGNIYVFQRGTSRISAFSPRGQLLATWPVTTARTFPGPGKLAIDGRGNISVLLGNSRQRTAYEGGIETFSSTGRVFARWYSPALLNAQALAADHGSALYAVMPVTLDGGALQTGRVVKFSSTGRVVASWQLSTAGYDFIAAAGIATDSHDTVYVSGSVGRCSRGCQGREADIIERFTPGGTMLPSLHFATGTIALGSGLAVDGRGNMFTGGDIELTEVSPSGYLVSRWGGTVGCAALRFRSIAGLALHGQHTLYVVDESNDNLHQLNVVTQADTLWGGCPATPPPAHFNYRANTAPTS